LMKVKLNSKFKSDLMQYREELSAQMSSLSKTNQNQELVTSLMIAKQLRQIDHHLEKDKFSDLFKEYQDKLDSLNQNLNQEIKNSIQQCNYQDVRFKIQ
jgi:CRISPR/Cas system CSM-associated protein Csm2 small subunit